MSPNERLVITDVAPRDGLQNQPLPVSTEAKLALIRGLAGAGVASIEATSFVSPKAVPQMADAAEVIAGCRDIDGLRVSALVPNEKGLERAIAAGAREIAVVLSATETMNQRNIRMSLAHATAACVRTLRQAHAAGLATRAYVAVAWQCPYEGAVPLDRVRELAAALAGAGAGEVVIADTIGAASPLEVSNRLGALAEDLGAARLGAHFHDTRGMGLANAYAALQCGVRRFDSSAGGLGGCPFAPGASGNLATEDLLLMAAQGGITTGIDLGALMAVVQRLGEAVQRPLGGRSAAWWRAQADRSAATARQ